MKRILGTGLSGLLGSHITASLGKELTFIEISQNDVDITNQSQLTAFCVQQSFDAILHLAAKTDVDSCEQDKTLGKEGAAWQINVDGTSYLVEIAQKKGVPIIYISTDFVFDGTQEFYTEADQPHPINWYGVTKYEAEKLVLSDLRNCVIRLAYPYGTKSEQKKDFVRMIGQKLARGEEVVAVADHYFTPTFIEDIVAAIGVVCNKNLTGAVHAVGSSFLTPFEAAQQIAHVFGFDGRNVKPTTRDLFYKNRAPRPYKLQLKNATISSYIHMKPFTQGLALLKERNYTL
ncbi:NAD(P)-dependent oxidoreductase [Candidatus Microgenomates bacterium]|nr:MAG: NAD(P)-dependent oxidoreductase [Candidatus Microgenomates bacterium]